MLIGIIHSSKIIYRPSLKLFGHSVHELLASCTRLRVYRQMDRHSNMCKVICPSFFKEGHKYGKTPGACDINEVLATLDELTVQVCLLYHHPNLKYSVYTKVGRNYRQTDGLSVYWMLPADLSGWSLKLSTSSLCL